MVGVNALLGAQYALRQRRKRLTHRSPGREAFGAFRRCVARLALERQVTVSIKVRRELDAALNRARRGPSALELAASGATDDLVVVLAEALRAVPVVDKVDLRGNTSLSARSGAALVAR